jgi:hypothetical protein
MGDTRSKGGGGAAVALPAAAAVPWPASLERAGRR